MHFVVGWAKTSDEWEVDLDEQVNCTFFVENEQDELLIYEKKSPGISFIVKIHFFPHNVH